MGVVMNKILKQFVSSCVHYYSTSNSLDDFYSLEVSDLPDFVREEFAALIISDNPSLASEATGADNPLWENKMFPALTNYLKRSYSEDAEEDFKTIWRESVTSYFYSMMQELLDNALELYNQDYGHTSCAQSYGVSAHGAL
jgi:hypothetical protein